MGSASDAAEVTTSAVSCNNRTSSSRRFATSKKNVAAKSRTLPTNITAIENCDTYRDFRELLDRSDIDAVLIATGPNWHATAAMTAAKAGKDMYCEKPVTKNISQSLILAETMQPYRSRVSGRHAATQPAPLRLCL